MAVLRTDVSASPAPDRGEREVAKVEVTPQRQAGRAPSTVSAAKVSSSASSTHIAGSAKFGDCHSMMPFWRSVAPVVAAKTKSDGP